MKMKTRAVQTSVGTVVWKTVWKSDFQNATKSFRELVESSAVNGKVWKS